MCFCSIDSWIRSSKDLNVIEHVLYFVGINKALSPSEQRGRKEVEHITREYRLQLIWGPKQQPKIPQGSNTYTGYNVVLFIFI